MSNLLNCRCGEPVELDFGGCTEFYGGTWQDVSVMCIGRCGYSVDITINADLDRDREMGEKLAIEAWNRLQAI